MFRLFCSAVKAKLPNKQHFYQHAAVAADNAECSKIGRNILKKGGSAVDSAIAAILCVGVINLHSTGIGGGGFMMVYDSHKRSAEMIDFRETAPQRAGVDLFKGDPMNGILGKIKYVCRRNCMLLKFTPPEMGHWLAGEVQRRFQTTNQNDKLNKENDESVAEISISERVTRWEKGLDLRSMNCQSHSLHINCLSPKTIL